MKIIFLDMDGVINFRYSRGWLLDRWESDLVERINKITDKTNAKIVLSSTWRKSFNNLDECQEKLDSMGFKVEVIGMTPVLPKIDIERGDEIQSFINMVDFEIEKFIIIDDEADMCHLLKYLVRTDYEVGITDENVEEAIKRLN